MRERKIKAPIKPALNQTDLMGVSLRELLSKELPPQVSRIWPWLDSGESCLLWGGTGAGKSMVAMTLALGVAGGGEVIGWKFLNPCRVLYVDGEQSTRDLQGRFALLSSTLKGHNLDEAKDNLLIRARTDSPAGSSFFDLNDATQVAPIITELKKCRVGFVIFDNLSTLSDSITDENAAAEFKNMQALFAHLKAANIASILVHHSGKSTEAKSYRGSSNIGTTFERIVGLTHQAQEPPTTLAVCAEIQKYRSKPPPGFSPQVHFRLVSTETAKGRTQTAEWKMDTEQGQLAEGWRMFSTGEYESVAEFIKAFNGRFGTNKKASNFAREFTKQWCLKLGISEADVERVKRIIRSVEDETAVPNF